MHAYDLFRLFVTTILKGGGGAGVEGKCPRQSKSTRLLPASQYYLEGGGGTTNKNNGYDNLFIPSCNTSMVGLPPIPRP